MFSGEIVGVTLEDDLILGIDILNDGEIETIYTDSLGLPKPVIMPGYKVRGLMVDDVGGRSATCLHVTYRNGKSQFYGNK